MSKKKKFNEEEHHEEEEAREEHEDHEEDEEGPDEDHPDVDDAYELKKEIDELADEVPERGEGFAASVVEKAQSILNTIESEQCVTTKQMTALQNMKAGLEKWIR